MSEKITKWFTAQPKQVETTIEQVPPAQTTESRNEETSSTLPSKQRLPIATNSDSDLSAKLMLLTEANQPRNHVFPSRTFGKQNFQRSFQPAWFDKFSWLHYDTNTDSTLRFTCVKALQHKMISSTKGEAAFTEKGFQNWKKALAKGKGFQKHESSECHKEATERFCKIPSTVKGDIGEIMSRKHALEKLHSRTILLKILGNIRYLARQGLPLRGDWKESESSEADSNFYQLIKLRCDEDPSIVEWLGKKTSKYISADIQNEMLEIMALRVLREIAQNIRNAQIYTILADETADVSNKEQLVLCIRWVDGDLVVHEDFIGMHSMKDTTADHIVFIIKDILQRMNLKLGDARGQCYDGAAAMAGSKNGVATKIKAINDKCLYTHCYGHALNLAVADSIKSVECLKGVFEVAREICKLVKKSPKRNTKLDELKKENESDSKGIIELCATRWTVRGEALAAILSNYHELMDLWEWSLETFTDTDMKARIRGVQAHMPTFDFLFGCSLAILLLKQTDNLSKTLQNSTMSAAKGNEIAQDVIETLSRDRSENSYNLFWEKVLKRKQHFLGNDPVLPRKRRRPQRLEDGNPATHHFPSTPKDHYRQIYFQALDTATSCIRRRFDQPDFRKYVCLQEMFLKAVKDEPWESELDAVCSVFGSDVNKFRLEAQLPLLSPTAKSMHYESDRFNVHDLIEFLQKLDESRKVAMSEVVKLAKILLVMPATNAVSERSFSAMKRVKTYSRSTTTDNRLNHLMVLHVHREIVDNLSLIAVANEFVERVDGRNFLFGQFTERDLTTKHSVGHKSTQT